MGTAQPQRQRAGSQELPRTGEPGLDCITAGAVTSTNLLHLSRFASTAPSWFLPVLSACLSSEPDVLYNISLSNPAEGGDTAVSSSTGTVSVPAGPRLWHGQAWMVSKPTPCCSPLGPQDTRFSGPISPPDPGWKHFANPRPPQCV